ncbi:exo-alpha-sialidase [Parapedobacter sp. 2B3]|uniref:exo-alpha-sialidase n=1 Tax=Parapedobacter sp. 2B3 TaxID=3342381 RepID=UPI0035B598FD
MPQAQLEIPLCEDTVGTVVAYQPAATKQYIGSPSLVILPNGHYVASHDLFGQASSEWVQGRTRIYGSADKGLHWRFLTDIVGAFWSNLFVHGDALYLMGPDRHFGTVLIRKSVDGGSSWTSPTNEQDGLLLKGEFHSAPVPMVVHGGRIWRAMETAHGPIREWGKRLAAMVMSAPVDADLLRADSWLCTQPLYFDPTYLAGHFNGWLEGNVVVTPEGTICNILRVDDKSTLEEKVAMVDIDADGTRASFDPKTGFVPFPGGSKKFTVRYDPVSQRYWSLTNGIPERLKPAYQGENSSLIRNTVMLVSSVDLQSWDTCREVIHHPDASRYGFQYVDWQFEGNDIIFVSRTAFEDGMGGPNRAHDANFLTFHRIEQFRHASSPAR